MRMANGKYRSYLELENGTIVYRVELDAGALERDGYAIRYGFCNSGS